MVLILTTNRIAKFRCTTFVPMEWRKGEKNRNLNRFRIHPNHLDTPTHWAAYLTFEIDVEDRDPRTDYPVSPPINPEQIPETDWDWESG